MALIWKNFGTGTDNLAMNLGALSGVLVIPDTITEITISDSSGYLYNVTDTGTIRQQPIWDAPQSSITITGRFDTQVALDAAVATLATNFATNAVDDDASISIVLGTVTWEVWRPRLGMFGLIPEMVNTSTVVTLQYQYLFDYITGGPSDPTRSDFTY